MYFWGELVIHYKVHTRKVYDFARRHLPAELLEAADPNITTEQYQDAGIAPNRRDWTLLVQIR